MLQHLPVYLVQSVNHVSCEGHKTEKYNDEYNGFCTLLRFSLLSLRTLGNLLLDNINHTRFSNSAEITELIAFTSNDLAHDATHDLHQHESLYDRLGRNRSGLAFPERVLGRSLTMKIFLGAAKGPITFLTWSTSSLAREASSLWSYVNSLVYLKSIDIQQKDKRLTV